jgi:histidinol-phosphate aminotransferase
MKDALDCCVNPQLRTLAVYETGKPIEETARELGLDPARIVKLASNENPLGPSPLALAAMRDALERAHFYPDGGGYFLREAIAAKHGVALENVVLGNGSNEIIEFLGHSYLNAEAEVVAAEHAFVVYRLMADLFGARTVEVPDPGFQHDVRAMVAACTPRTRLLFVANPNNPTGTDVPEADLDWLVNHAPPHVIVVLDEAYYEFQHNPPDTMRYVKEDRNVVIMRTFSKAQGLAGLRIGYGVMPRRIAQWLQRSRQPFNANAIAQAGALAGLRDLDHQAKTRSVTDVGRVQLEEAFSALGLEFVPSRANFILVRTGRGRAVFDALLKRGVIVRAMDGYKLPEWVRVSIGTPEQNAVFLKHLPEAMAAAGAGAAPAGKARP